MIPETHSGSESMDRTNPFALFNAVASKYKSSVHQLGAPASEDAVRALESHIGRRLPDDLRTFLRRHNGASMFKALFTLRSVSEIGPSSAETPHVLLIGHSKPDTHWAMAARRHGNWVVGRWADGVLEPLHASFTGWLNATLTTYESRVHRPSDVSRIRLETDPHDPFQLLRAGMGTLRDGRPEQAAPMLHEATTRDAGLALAWQRLGDAFAPNDKRAALESWLTALQRTELPTDFPGAPLVDPELFRTLARALPDSESWERELERFISERVHDVRTDAEFDLVVAANMSLAQSLVARGRRHDGRSVLADLLSRSLLYSLHRVPWRAALELTALEIDLGHHDEAEALLRRVREEGPAHVQAAAGMLLGRIAVMREEPWAEEILADASSMAEGVEDPIRIALLQTERAIRQNRPSEAREFLASAQELVARGAPRRLRAHLAAAQGDVCKLADDLDGAREAYRRALDLLSNRSAVELSARITLRLGDLSLAAGSPVEAAEHYRSAAEAFASHDLPVREAWALVRLARLAQDRAPLLERAREHFLAADHAAGVAVVDALSTDPSISLAWHLERSTAHARARYDAQRSRPPWTRSDADRPERRLGAHRMAIAASGPAIVDALAAELDANARAVQAGRGRATEPAVLRYIAAADLLAGHRSYAAAQVLLRHLLDRRVDGLPRRALEGAVARSPNAAVVDGLLRTCEQASQHTADAVAVAASVLGLRREASATPALLHLASEEANPIARRAAIVALGRIGQRQHVNRIAPALDHPALAEPAALALLMLGDRRGVDFHAEALSDEGRRLTNSPGELVGRHGGPEHLFVLYAAATRGNDDASLGALHGLGLLGDPRAVPTLLQCLDPRHPKRTEVASAALEVLTGHHESLDEAGAIRRWHNWWEEHETNFPVGIRHRDGKVFDMGILLSRMSSQDPWVRRTAYDELVIQTGQLLPFDVDGPWRVQRRHLTAWHTWWKNSRLRLPGGRWYLDGKIIT